VSFGGARSPSLCAIRFGRESWFWMTAAIAWRWSRWIWNSFKQHGLWQPLRSKVAKTVK